MSQLVDSIEAVRKDRLIGWYHSHPFDVREVPNWFFSMVDVQTQNSWQHMFERSGSKSDPFFGIVVDPLRALAKGRPEMGAFRNYPPSYKPPNPLLGPDGKVWPSESSLTERWGPACMSYYSMDILFFQSTLSRRVLDVLAREHLWARTLASAPFLDKESRESTAQRVRAAGALLDTADTGSGGRLASSLLRVGGSEMPGSKGTMDPGSSVLTSCSTKMASISSELLQGQALQTTKYLISARIEEETAAVGASSSSAAASSSSSSASG
jgi:COP9 signalosome complex subunit 5